MAIAHEEDHVTAIELAQWIRERRPGLRIIDLRPAAEFAAYHIPRAERMTIESLPSIAFQPSETIVLISDAGGHAAQGWVLLQVLGQRNVYFLRGGIAEWLDAIMSPAQPSDLTRYFGGMPRVGGAPTDTGASAAVTAMRRRGC